MFACCGNVPKEEGNLYSRKTKHKSKLVWEMESRITSGIALSGMEGNFLLTSGNMENTDLDTSRFIGWVTEG